MSGHYKIDRDADCFCCILNYLRTNEWKYEGDKEKMAEELDYYQIVSSCAIAVNSIV